MACQVQSGPDPGLLGAQARDSVCLLEIKHAAFCFTKREHVQNHDFFPLKTEFSVKDRILACV